MYCLFCRKPLHGVLVVVNLPECILDEHYVHINCFPGNLSVSPKICSFCQSLGESVLTVVREAPSINEEMDQKKMLVDYDSSSDESSNESGKTGLKYLIESYADVGNEKGELCYKEVEPTSENAEACSESANEGLNLSHPTELVSVVMEEPEIHNPEPPSQEKKSSFQLTCGVCGKTFKSTSGKSRCESTHKGPFFCVCGKMFRRQDSIPKHKKRHNCKAPVKRINKSSRCAFPLY